MSVVKDVRSRGTAVVATKTHEMPHPGKRQDLTACVSSRRARSGEKSQTEMWTTAFLLAWFTFINAAHFPSSSRLFPTSGHCDPSLGSLQSHPSAVHPLLLFILFLFNRVSRFARPTYCQAHDSAHPQVHAHFCPFIWPPDQCIRSKI